MIRSAKRAFMGLALGLAVMASAGCPRQVTPNDFDGNDTPSDAQQPPLGDVPIGAHEGGVVPGSDVVSPPTPDATVPIGEDPPVTPATDIDLLIEVDNSNSMAANQLALTGEITRLVGMLTSPPDANNDGRPDFTPFETVHVGVVSSDLGTPGATVPGCANPDIGDDGLLNPIRFGGAMARHEPWASAQAGLRPSDCTDPAQFPSFIGFDSGRTNLMTFSHDVQCNAALLTGGCGLEQQLEAVWRAVVFHRADDAPGNTDPNAGFLRRDALLAIVVLSDEEDGSVRDCRYAENGVPCSDAVSVFRQESAGWASTSLNMRFYLDRPCGADDPTWPLDRYIDPTNPTRGFLSVKPGHPERVLFAAITGIPLNAPVGADGARNWNALLGTPNPMMPDDFCGRDSSTAIHGASPEGYVSMVQATRDPDPACTERVAPACRREGTTATSGACNPLGAQYFAWPARRIVEVARRFDEAPLCGGAPCRNGVVGSICANSFGSPISELVERINARRR